MKKHIPNTITACNLVSGCIAIVFAVMGDPVTALLFIVLGAVFDFFDGMVARRLGVSSPVGKELDSLADCVTFGVAPSAILYYTLKEVVACPIASECVSTYLPFAAFIMAGFSALRLAKFNLDERQTSSFIGLPTPPVSMLTASLIALFDPNIPGTYNVEWLRNLASNPYVILAYVAIFSYLMVCELPMFSLKFKHLHWKGNEPKFILLGSSIILLAVLQLAAIPAIILLFIAMSVILYLMNSKEAAK